MSAMYFAAPSSLPGGLVVLIRIKPRSHPSASFSSLERSDACRGEVLGGACGWVGAVGADDCRRFCPGVAVANTMMQAKVRRETRAVVRAINCLRMSLKTPSK